MYSMYAVCIYTTINYLYFIIMLSDHHYHHYQWYFLCL